MSRHPLTQQQWAPRAPRGNRSEDGYMNDALGAAHHVPDQSEVLATMHPLPVRRSVSKEVGDAAGESGHERIRAGRIGPMKENR
jgi:hypothetical protein